MKKFRYIGRFYFIVLITGLLPACSANAAWDDILNVFTAEKANGNLSSNEIVLGLKEALANGSHTAIGTLGRTDGYFRNRKVKIRMPDKLEKMEKLLDSVGQGEVADEFVLSMNRAAEEAVPEVADIFSSALREMSFSDARSILQGPDDAATQYFRRTSGERMADRMLPIVSHATGQTGVTARYKQMVGKLDFAANLVDTKSLDLDRYV
ncbi:MAG TPA: DUF4197 domain-containing protein, partial [Gammaproteobacteria bacterium]|nr:DUF4197 domain-containing protein [Gammaproteobacteria bacterium]